jgi:hypothetical protein
MADVTRSDVGVGLPAENEGSPSVLVAMNPRRMIKPTAGALSVSHRRKVLNIGRHPAEPVPRGAASVH